MVQSKSQIDKLGERLKAEKTTETDLRELDDYRRAFSSSYQQVTRTIRERLRLEPTGRPAKSTPSIVEKLKRESVRLTQIQDIAGCRIVVENTREQDRAVDDLEELFPSSVIIDRREKPSHGYRAVHVVVSALGEKVEIQVRTLLQHRWAELSEKIADRVGSAIKYGGGNEEVRQLLDRESGYIVALEQVELELAGEHGSAGDQELERRVESLRRDMDARLLRLIAVVEEVWASE